MRAAQFGGLALGCLALMTWSPADALDGIGIFTGVYGEVTVTRGAANKPTLVRVKDSVLFRDLIETRVASRMRALLDDDTLLTLAENSRLEITEHIYDRAAGTRTAVLKLARGTVRALVGKVFGGSSKFEIHTHNATAAARGTYFVVWMDADGQTGVANIGDAGDVAFLAGGQEVVVKPGQYSLTLPNRLPLPPAVIPQTGTARGAVRATELRENIAVEMPHTTLQALGGVIERELPRPRLSVRPVVSGALTEEPQTSTATSGANLASPFPARATSGGNGIGPTGLAPGNGLSSLGAGLGTPNPNAALITPPAVISGGVPRKP